MLRKVFFVCAVTAVLQQTLSLTTTEIRTQYQPTLLRLRDVASSKYQDTNKQYSALVDQINKHQTKSKNSTQTQINNVKNALAEAKKTPNITSNVLSCLKVQEAAINRLSIYPINNCYSSTNISLLSTVKGRFSTLSSLASNTLNYCSYLNPLETQLQSYERCVADKIPDLNRQINIVENQYHDLSNSTINYSINCLSDKVGSIMGQISIISYQINICFFL